jgi:hypothetical protein
MRPLRQTYAVLIAVSTAVLTLALTAPAQAVSAGWIVALTRHYGPATNYSAFTATAAASTTDAWAFGTTNGAGLPAPGTPVAEHWNGTRWSSSALPAGLSSTIAAASVGPASNVWAVTEVGGDILHWDGSRWAIADHVPGSGLMFTGITPVSNTDVWAFGSSSAGPGIGTWHFDGTTWTQVTGSAVGLVSASAVSATDVWGIGSTARGPSGDILTHYNGTSWKRVTAPALTGLEFYSILAQSSTDVWATAGNGHGGAAQLVHFDGSQWTSIGSPYPTATLSYFAPDGQGGFWMDSYHGASKTWLFHYAASGQWTRTTLGTGSMGPLALVPGTTSLWGVGSAPTATPASNARIWAG